MAKIGRALHNCGGRIFLQMMIPGLDRIYEENVKSRAVIHATRAVLGLKMYERKEGRLSESLDDLVRAKILPGIPQDPFSGKDLLYSRERARVWSVGPNEADDGGTSDMYEWSEEDYVIGIPGRKK